MTIGQRIKQKREELGMSQEELATKIGFKSRSSINKIELDKQFPKQSMIAAFAKILNTTPNYLLGVEDEIKQQEQELCELFKLCHGTETFQMVQSFLKLDQTDRLVIYGEILGMLKHDKYTEKKEPIHAKVI